MQASIIVLSIESFVNVFAAYLTGDDLVAHLLQFFVELSYDFVGLGNGDAQFLCYFRCVNQSVVH